MFYFDRPFSFVSSFSRDGVPKRDSGQDDLDPECQSVKTASLWNLFPQWGSSQSTVLSWVLKERRRNKKGERGMSAPPSLQFWPEFDPGGDLN